MTQTLWDWLLGKSPAPADRRHPNLTAREVRDAERRWAASNAETEANPFCRCGAAGTVKLHNPPQWSVVGSIQPFWWRCDEHKHVPLTATWSSNGDGKWTTRHGCSRDECRSQGSSIATGRITYCDCGTHVGEIRANFRS